MKDEEGSVSASAPKDIKEDKGTTRRKFLTAAGGVAAVATLAACGKKEEAKPAMPATPAAPAAPAVAVKPSTIVLKMQGA